MHSLEEVIQHQEKYAWISSANYENRHLKTKKTMEHFPIPWNKKNHWIFYYEIMPSLEQKNPSNTDEISISKQVKSAHFFSWKFSTSIVLEREKCSFETRQSSISNLPLPTSNYSI